MATASRTALRHARGGLGLGFKLVECLHAASERVDSLDMPLAERSKPGGAALGSQSSR